VERTSAGADSKAPAVPSVAMCAAGIERALRIGCELSSRVAAIAPVSGNMATATGSAHDVPCRLNRPVSVLAIHGTADPIVPLAGGQTDINYAPLSEVMLKWRELNGCADYSAVSVSGPSMTTSWPSLNPSVTSVLIPSLIPILICTGTGLLVCCSLEFSVPGRT